MRFLSRFNKEKHSLPKAEKKADENTITVDFKIGDKVLIKYLTSTEEGVICGELFNHHSPIGSFTMTCIPVRLLNGKLETPLAQLVHKIKEVV